MTCKMKYLSIQTLASKYWMAYFPKSNEFLPHKFLKSHKCLSNFARGKFH